MFEVGNVIGGKYRILGELGQGGMSTVYLVVNEKSNKLWAMKKVRKAEASDSELLKESLQVEIQTLKKLKHPNLPSVVEVLEQQDEYLVVMDYIEGVSLGKLLEEKDALDESQVVQYAIQLCDVLSYLHTRKPAIIYRDMKPSNIVLRPDGTVVLIDFGTAREFKENAARDTNNLGTCGYAAPEQFGKKGQTDARTDIYCLGMTLYQLLTAHNPAEPPYEIYPIRKWNPRLSAGLERIIDKCIQKNPNDRFQTADELMQALLHYQEYGMRRKRRYKKKLGAVVLMTLLSVVCACSSLYLRDRIAMAQMVAVEQMVQISNLLFALAIVIMIIAVMLLFSYDNRKKTIRRKKRSRIQSPPPATVELAPRAVRSVDKTEQLLRSDGKEWEILQDITYVHANMDIGKNGVVKADISE